MAQPVRALTQFRDARHIPITCAHFERGYLRVGESVGARHTQRAIFRREEQCSTGETAGSRNHRSDLAAQRRGVFAGKQARRDT